MMNESGKMTQTKKEALVVVVVRAAEKNKCEDQKRKNVNKTVSVTKNDRYIPLFLSLFINNFKMFISFENIN